MVRYPCIHLGFQQVRVKVMLEYSLKLSRVGALSFDSLWLAQMRIGAATQQQGTEENR